MEEEIVQKLTSFQLSDKEATVTALDPIDVHNIGARIGSVFNKVKNVSIPHNGWLAGHLDRNCEVRSADIMNGKVKEGLFGEWLRAPDYPHLNPSSPHNVNSESPIPRDDRDLQLWEDCKRELNKDQLEEQFWRQKARISWLQNGDKNSKYFHAQTAQRRKINSITKIHKEDGTPCVTTEEITGCIEESTLNSLLLRALQEGRHWNLETLHSIFSTPEIKAILTIKGLDPHGVDKLVWDGTTSDHPLSVSSVYSSLMEGKWTSLDFLESSRGQKSTAGMRIRSWYGKSGRTETSGLSRKSENLSHSLYKLLSRTG
ncbi:reverse transcriptase [Striga asiatica]|uniref:Reverse transcriptase n=1 Tax=Striga asiatica TaxID=4170 RepID=A0A5A7PKF1_STRAF|nr:reverse transcriptase [Striga asiatica]